jgi:hypothetical protein
MSKSKNILNFFLFLGSLLFAGTDGTIRGKVTDIEGSPLPGANIYIPDVGTGAAADMDGNYIMLNIPVGEYNVVVQMMGYQKQTMTDVGIVMDQTVWLNFKLPVAAVEGDAVEVLGTKPLVEKGSTSKKVTVSSEAIQSLPIRDLSELYTLQSGVVKVVSRNKSVPDHEERGLEEIHVKGGRSGEIAYMMDGMYLRNPIFGSIGSGTRLNVFAISEFDWQPGGFNAEYGDAQSAVSNWHTSSGGKEIEYHFKFETSQVGAFLNSTLGGNDLETNNYDLIRGYDDYNFGIGGPVLGIPRLTFWVSGQYTTDENFSVYQFDDKVYQGNKYFLNEADLDLDLLNQNKKNLVYPWDDVAGFRGFGFSNTWDVFTKLSYKLTNKLRFHAAYWQVGNHRQAFNPRYLYWDQGRNELFRDTYRWNFEVNHSVTQRTFYTLRASRFTQDQFQGVRWNDNDKDGYPNWFEYRHPAGYKEISDIDNPYVVPYGIGEDGDTVRYTNKDPRSGWYHGATPGLWSWELAEDFDDMNGNGVWDAGESFSDENESDSWDGPVLVKTLENRDGSYWLEPEMYEDYEPFFDDQSVDLLWQNAPGYFGTPQNNGGFFPGVPNPFYYMPDFAGVFWDEGRTFGGHDDFYADSRAITDEIRFDLTSQISDKWKVRVGIDYKYHKLNFYEVKYPWLGTGAKIQTFAEYWQDTGPDGLLLGDEGYEEADAGENNGRWDSGEAFTDANKNGQWDEFREPEELSAYIQNVFEVPWMVINYGVRIDMVHYNTQIWADTLGAFSPGRPWFYSDLNDNDVWDQESEQASDIAGLARQKILLMNSDWSYKISPRIGFSHVITDKSTFTFNYGLYYQNPVYQDIYLNTNNLEDPEELFEEGEGAVGNARMNAQRTQSYEAAFNVQVGQNWAYSFGAFVKDMDQLTRYTLERSGVYQYNVASNGDYGSAKGIDLTLEWRSAFFGSQLQYTYSKSKTNSEYAWASISGQYVDAPSQENLAYYDRPHSATYYAYTFLPLPFIGAVQAGMTAFYQSGYPYTPIIFKGKDPAEDSRHPNSKRGPAYRNIDLSFSKYLEFMGHNFSLGLGLYNVFDIRNAVDVYAMTGKADDPGTYYTNYVGLPGTDPNGAGVYADKSSAYYDRPWRYSTPREINFFLRFDFE